MRVTGLLCLVLVVGCDQADRSATTATPTAHAGATPVPEPSVTSSHPVKTSILLLAGKVTYGEDYYSKISSPVQGRVLEVRARLGQEVQAGEVLLVIESPDMNQAYSDYIRETSELDLAQRTYELTKGLYESKAVAFKDLKQVENDLIKEQAEFEQAKARLLALKVPRHELEKPVAEQTGRGRFELRSPLSGTVVERTVTPGQWVGADPAQMLMTVVDLDRLQVAAEVYERDLPRLTVGQAALVTVEAYPGEVFPATIARIGDLVDRDTRTVKVRAWLSNPGHRLKPEMYARLKVTGNDEPESPSKS
jgi:cobalt-zinc-cadmium efflux system membrane fusion protein